MRTKIILLGILSVSLFSMAGWSYQQNAQPETMPLVPMMRLLLTDMYTVDEGIYTEDFQKIEEGAVSIADHPVMTEEDKKLVKATLGENMKQFVEFDMIVHHHADSIAGAAQKMMMKEILRHYRIVQQGCVDCHSNFRSQIIEAKE